jgi:hypothetical protein
MVHSLNFAIMERALTIILGNYVGVPAPLCRKLWKVLQRRRRDGYCQAILYALRRPVSDDADVYACAQAAFAGVLSPRKFVPWIDALVASGDLTRCEGTAIQDAVLSRCTAHGNWRDW